MKKDGGESIHRDEFAELAARLVHEVSTPMAIAKVNLELIARYLPSLVSNYVKQADYPPDAAAPIHPEHLEALRNAPSLIEEQCRVVEQRVKFHWRAAAGKDAPDGQNRDLGTENHSAGLDAKGLRILVVEDEVVHQDIALKVLAADHQVEVTGNAREALGRCELRPYDLILLDLCLPDLDGRQLPKLMRLTHSRGLYIAALTSLPTTDEELRQAGFDGQLEKPLKPESFRQFLQLASLGSRQEN
ncbi:response regulator [Proteobacteria bacterium 005FR1]|nr:response regulator [Proteobacteria bacterium 005FR1]